MIIIIQVVGRILESDLRLNDCGLDSRLRGNDDAGILI